MQSNEALRVFIGSGEASVLERKVLIYSIKKHTKRKVDIYVFNGTHNAVEKNNEPPVLTSMSLRVKYRNFTEFSNYRFLIPELCNYEGKAIWADSDMICLGDISELLDIDMAGADMLARADAYQHTGSNRWGLSLTVFDCTTCRFDIEKYFDEIEQGLYTYTDLHQMTEPFLARHPYRLAEMPPHWNIFDYYDDQTKLIHYTNLDTQPWKYPGHPYGELWFQYFTEAREAGFITDEDINKSIARAYVRRSIVQGNNPPQPVPASNSQVVQVQPNGKSKPGYMRRIYRKIFS